MSIKPNDPGLLPGQKGVVNDSATNDAPSEIGTSLGSKPADQLRKPSEDIVPSKRPPGYWNGI